MNGKQLTVERADDAAVQPPGPTSYVCLSRYDLFVAGEARPDAGNEYFANGIGEWPGTGETEEVTLSRELTDPEVCLAETAGGVDLAVIGFTPTVRELLSAQNQEQPSPGPELELEPEPEPNPPTESSLESN